MTSRIRGLDVLRGCAIAAVFVYHATPGAIGEGLGTLGLFLRSFLWAGVDLFFVLSGFLITRILIATRDRPRYFSTFYARRMLRIFPLYYLFVAAMLFGPVLLRVVSSRAPSVLQAEQWQRLWAGQGWLWLYLQNFQQAAGPGRFPGMGHLWSLAVEEQYYLVWPLLVRMARRWMLRLIAGLLLMVVVSRMVASFSGTSPWAIMHLTWFRLDGLLVGGAVAVLEQSPQQNAIATRCRKGVVLLALGTMMTVGCVCGTFDWIEPTVQQFGFFAFSLLAGCVVHKVVNSTGGGSTDPGVLTAFFCSLGKYSYALYIFHMPVIHAVRSLTGHSPSGKGLCVQLCASALISYGLAWLSWHFYEKHWLRYKPGY